jgi:hypothetical protein
MPQKYKVSLERSSSISEIPGDWTTKDYYEILRLTDYGDAGELSDTDVRDMARMSLADLPKNEAAELLMNYAFPAGALTPGQVQNASHEMEDEKLWEEYADPAQHRNFFRVASLLYAAYNGGFPKPDARQLTVLVKPGHEGKALMAEPDPALVLRLLAPGMSPHALLHRLYENELTGQRFAAAENIIWSVTSTPNEDGSYTLEILSSDYWLEAFDPNGEYDCVAYPDTIEEEEED